MKIRMTLKDPDGVSNDTDEAVRKSLADLGLDDDETETLVERRREKVKKKLEKWIRYGEYVTVEFDLDAGTATVVENKER